ncbi:hypothetical protein [Streptomyces sp. S816]|uniref:hypothetical protein n=1 Tax=Streptomyces TaxID=1883 RepID=UPI00109CB7CF|nr:hypothetical protein [Streptomyces sp. S816]
MNDRNQEDISTASAVCSTPQSNHRHPQFPGRRVFGPGHANSWILMVRLRLIDLGYAKKEAIELEKDPGLTNAKIWDDQLRVSYTRFQLALGLRGARADGYPGHDTWWHLWE